MTEGSAPCGPCGVRALRSGNPTPMARANSGGQGCRTDASVEEAEKPERDLVAAADLKPDDAGYANFALQSAASGYVSAASARSGILSAAVVPTRRTIRHEGGTFVGKEGGERVKAILDALANELNSPRFGNAGELLAEIGIVVEWEAVQSRILGDAEIAALKGRLLDGEIPFGPSLQNKLCVALGVDAYNDFVSEYNGK